MAIRYDTEAVRDWLRSIQEREREVGMQIERYERLKARMEAAGAQSLSDMPKSHSSGDRMGEYLAKKEELENRINRIMEEQATMTAKAEAILSRACTARERILISMRYFDDADWAEIIDVIFGNGSSSGERSAAYYRRIHRLHKRALINMAEDLNWVVSQAGSG